MDDKIKIEDAFDAVEIALRSFAEDGIVIFAREVTSVKKDKNEDWKVSVNSPKYVGVIDVYSNGVIKK